MKEIPVIVVEQEKKKKRFEIWYAKDPQFNLTELPKNLGDLLSRYIWITDVHTEDLGHAWRMMQGEEWSPNGDANLYIRRLGLKHTSMSVGDILRDEDGNWIMVLGLGFYTIPFINQQLPEDLLGKRCIDLERD